ncbi:MAG: hypothetical protein NZ529_02680 [Cytophagaceae bacterium]|nr:hypothetical protein [Cytophagaceae bacterium]MDW8455676.1 hypothetical protein [Cytophagaceae bacterium]
MTTCFRYIPLILCASALFIYSCRKPKDKDEQPPNNDGGGTNTNRKVYILNEGAFNNSNASVSRFDINTKTMTNDLFGQKNGRPLGDVLQSMAIIKGKAYFVMNNSNRIEVANESDMSSVAVINGLAMPRYITYSSISDKAYVTEWVGYDASFNPQPTGRVSVIDVNNNTIVKTINVGSAPENMILHNNKLFVANSNANTISVIDINSETVINTITVEAGPESFVKDNYDKIWVICKGRIIYDFNPPDYVDEANSIAGALARINPSTYQVEYTYHFTNNVGSPSRLQISPDKNWVYFTYESKVYKFPLYQTNPSPSLFINSNYYGLGVDMHTGNVYGGTYGFTSNQWMVRHTPAGAKIDSFQVGIGPNGFLFK